MARTPTGRPQQASRRPGRPRDARADTAILDAAFELFVDEGFASMTMEGVAERAGVGKTTVYRRWSSKEDLVAASVARLVPDVQASDSGNVRDDLIAMLTQFQEVLATTAAGEVFPRMAPEIAGGTPLGRAYQQKVIGPRFLLIEQTLRKAMQRGEVAEIADLEPFRDLILGAVMVGRLTNRLSAGTARARAEALTDAILDGLRRR